jgi:hypothetical protein
LQITGLVVFWAGVIWLFWSKAGNTVLRVVGSLFALACLGGCLYLHWEPYVAMVCLPAGFIAGVLYAEWHYGIHRFTGPRRDQEHQRPPSDRMADFQPARPPTIDYERGAPTYQSDPAHLPRG